MYTPASFTNMALSVLPAISRLSTFQRNTNLDSRYSLSASTPYHAESNTEPLAATTVHPDIALVSPIMDDLTRTFTANYSVEKESLEKLASATSLIKSNASSWFTTFKSRGQDNDIKCAYEDVKQVFSHVITDNTDGTGYLRQLETARYCLTADTKDPS